MEIRTTNRSYLEADSGDINDVMDMIACALIIEGYHPDTIREALIGKAETMVEEFNIGNDDEK